MSENLRQRLFEDAEIMKAALNELPLVLEQSSQAVNCAYSLGAGGKRVRPFLVLQSCLALGGQQRAALPAACAVEMIHTYSLIHDDLPGMDDDDLRRGKPSLHKVCGTRQALLAGDRLLIEAFREILRTPLDRTRLRAMVKTLAGASGLSKLVGGQFMDMYHPEKADMLWTKRMINGKTSAMIRVSMELGSLAAGISAAELASVSRIGDDIGWLFQLTDDILDVTGSQSEMGKAVSKDSDSGKWNPVSELGIQGAGELAKGASREIRLALKKLPGDWSVIEQLVDYLPERRE
jgi:geranylgeranyl diphosphate synthase type II